MRVRAEYSIGPEETYGYKELGINMRFPIHEFFSNEEKNRFEAIDILLDILNEVLAMETQGDLPTLDKEDDFQDPDFGLDYD